MWGKRFTKGQTTDYNMAHAHCTFCTEGYTHTHSGYVILVAVPLQWLLHEHASMLRHMHFASLVYSYFWSPRFNCLDICLTDGNKFSGFFFETKVLSSKVAADSFHTLSHWLFTSHSIIYKLHSLIRVINQLVAQNFVYSKFIKCLYMFRALLCSSSGGQNERSLNLCTGRPPTGLMIPDAV